MKIVLQAILLVAFAGGLWVAAGCQHHDRRPLDVNAHREAWRHRDIAGEPIADFARRLSKDSSDQTTKVAYDPTDGLMLEEAEIVALFFNPQLRAARMQVGVALAGAANAGLWDDPVLEVDAARIVESVAEPWVIATSLSFTIPISGRLKAERLAATAEHRAALARVAVEEWQIVAALRSTWLEWSAARLRAALSADVVERLEEVVSIVDRLEQVGEIARIESRLFRLERAVMASDLQAAQGRAAELELALKALLGLRPDAPLNLLPTVAVSDRLPIGLPHESQLEWSNPEVAQKRAEYEVAEESLQLELRKQYPDVGIGPSYQNEDGQSRIGLVGSLPLMFFNRNKRGIAETLAQREAARAAFDAEYELAAGQLALAHLGLENARQLRIGLETDVAPLVDEQLRDARRSAELGELNTLLQLESLTRSHQIKLRLIDARLAEAAAANRIRKLLGPSLPHQENVTDPSRPSTDFTTQPISKGDSS